MKLGLISDVHANLVNLRRAFVILRQHGAEAILCAGDLVDGESEGNAAVEYIKEQGCPCVQGNHDLAISRANAAHWLARWDEAAFGEMPQRYRKDIVSDENRAFLHDLPLTRRFEWDNTKVLLAHASLWDRVTYLFANGLRENFYRIGEEANADAVILGHTHTPMAVYVKGIWIFNPGSVDGNRFDPYNSTCAILDLPEMHFQVYDIDTARPVQYVRARFN